jgi:hypothetical protein
MKEVEGMDSLESAQALMGIARKINDFLAPMGGYVCGEITVTSGRFTPAMQITIGFPADRLKQYTAQDASPAFNIGGFNRGME